MKRFKKIYLLLGVLAAACVATFGVMRYEEHKEQIKNSEEVILELPKDSVKKLSWETDSESFSFRKEEAWIYEGDEAFPADEEKIGDLLEPFEAFGVSFVIEDIEDYGQYGLDEPVCTIRMETEEQSCEILLGSYSEMDSERYVSVGDGKVYLVKEDPMELFDVGLSDLIRQDETPSFEAVTAVRFSGEETYQMACEEDSGASYCAGDVYFTEQDGEKKALDTELVDNYLDRIEGLLLTDYVTYNATEEELASFGLDDPELSVAVDYTYENEEKEEVSDTFVLHVSRDPEERKAAAEAKEDKEGDAGKESEEEESAEEETITAYARVGESPIVYRISGDDYEHLTAASYDDLRHQEVLCADFSDIAQMDISLEGELYTLTSETGEEEAVWHYQGEETEISDLRTALVSMKAVRFTEEEPGDKEEIGLTVYLGDENGSKISVSLYRYDGDTCLAVVDGEPVSLVRRLAVVDLIEAVHGIVLGKRE